MYDLGLPEGATRTVVLEMTRPISYLVLEVGGWHVEVLHLGPRCQVGRRHSALCARENWRNGCRVFVDDQSGKRYWGEGGVRWVIVAIGADDQNEWKEGG